jgi:hypothetical protein
MLLKIIGTLIFHYLPIPINNNNNHGILITRMDLDILTGILVRIQYSTIIIPGIDILGTQNHRELVA